MSAPSTSPSLAGSEPGLALREAQPAAPAGELAPRYRKYLAACESLRRGLIGQLEFQMRGLKSAGVDRGAEIKIRELESDLAALRQRKRRVAPTLRFPPDVGGIGTIPGGGAHVSQILGDDAFLARVSFPDFVVEVRGGKRYRQPAPRAVALLVRGVPTSELGEGSDAPLPQVFEIVAEESLTMSDGTKRRFLSLRPLDVEALEQRSARNRQPKPPGG